MRSMKLLAAMLLSVVLSASLAIPVFAHGGHHTSGHHSGGYTYTQPAPAALPACGVSGCTVSGTHTHSCAYHPDTVCSRGCCGLCTVEDCTLTGRHTHDEVTFCSNSHRAGYCDGTCYALCTVKGCTTGGHHVHDNVTFCGNHHAGGFCENDCATWVPRRCCRH